MINLIFCLCTFNDIQPVAAGTFGILRGQDLDPVSVLDFIVNINQLSVYTGAYHLISHRTVDGIGKIDRR